MVVIEDFESGDLSNYSGKTSVFSVESNDPYEGTYHLSSSASDYGTIYNIDGTLTYPEQGDSFSVFLKGGNYMIFLWAVQDNVGGTSPYGYGVKVQPGIGASITIYEGGFGSDLATTSADLSSGVWYKLSTTWESDGTITCTVSDTSGTAIETITATDTTYSSGGVGFRGYGTSRSSSKADYATLPSPPSAPTNLSLNVQ